MTLTLEKTYPRLWSVDRGTVMVVTDLHGDWATYERYRDRFVGLMEHGQVDAIILAGDMIHAEDEDYPDESLRILQDVLQLRQTYGDAIIYLCGNHELPHLYGFSLSKGNKVYTPSFEKALDAAGCREEIISLFDSLPFIVRTRAGVSITHAGASPALADPQRAEQLFSWDHAELRQRAAQQISTQKVEVLRQSYGNQHGMPYDKLAEYYLNITDPNDPRYDDLLIGSMVTQQREMGRVLWPALFTRCEIEYPIKSSSLIGGFLQRMSGGGGDSTGYDALLEDSLATLSTGYSPQAYLVAGHMAVRGGHQLIADRHLRLASGYHAEPRTAGQYLRFDAAAPISSANALMIGLETVFRD